MKKVLLVLPVALLVLATGCDSNKKAADKKLSCLVDMGSASISTTVDVEFENGKTKGIESTTVLVFDSEDEANEFNNEDPVSFGGEIVKREGAKVTIKSTDKENAEALEMFKGLNYEEVKSKIEEMGATCK